ncbi:MAG: hypothetical protein ACXADW_15160 [Candidatus Hodarchaeales archaeon]|jgi:hypothetical protein
MFNLSLQKGDIISVRFWHGHEELVVKSIEKNLFACSANNDIKIPVNKLDYNSKEYQGSSRWRFLRKIGVDEDDYINFETIE